MKTNKEQGTITLYQLIKQSVESKPLFIVGILANCLSTVASVMLTNYFSTLIDSFSSSQGVGDNIIIVVVLFLLQIVFGVVSVYVLNYIGLKSITKIRKDVLSKVVKAKMEFFDYNAKGEISSRMINDSSLLMNLITTSLSECIAALISIVAAMYLMFRISISLTLIILLIFVVFLVVLLPLTSRLSNVSKRIQENTASLSSFVVQALSNIRLVKSTVEEKHVIKDGNSISQEILNESVNQVKFMAVLSPIVNIILLGSVFFIIVIGGVFVGSNEITIGQLSAFLMLLVLQVITPAMTLISFLTSFQTTRGALQRIIELLNMKSEDVSSGASILNERIQNIQFQNVHFTYPLSENEVLKGVSFDIKEKEYVALIGPSGSGKSTIFSLLEHFYDIQSGEILINQTSINDLSLESLRANIGYVTQDALLMDGTIKDNLLFGVHKEVKEDDLWKACEMADIAKFVRTSSNGFDTLIGEQGINMSGGQRQRLTIARTLLADNSLILLDEATSSLDSISEQRIQSSIEAIANERILMVIAHRLSTVLHAKKIMFLDDGEITGIGTHEELMKHHEKYRVFYTQQFQENRNEEDHEYLN